MPIAPNFLGGGASSGITLPPATNIITQAASGRVYIRWNDPNDVTIQSGTLATWAGTLLVRQQGGWPETRYSGTVVLDSKTRNQYQEDWFCDSGLTNGVTYFYRLIPYSTDGFYTYDDSCCFSVTPRVIDPGTTSELAVASAGDGKLNITWDDPNQQSPLGNRLVQSLTVNVEPKQDGNGVPSPANVRAISGWTYADVTREASYVSDGLIFHLDGIDRGGVDGKWIDLIGGKEFTLTGVTIPTNNNCVQFSGTNTSYGVYNGCVSGDFQNETIEICVEKSGTDRAFALSQPKNTATGKFGISVIYAQDSGSGIYYVADGKYYAAKNISGVAFHDYKTISMTHDGASCIDLSLAQKSDTTGYWTAQTSGKTYVGIRNSSGSSRYPFKGKIYSIRIYNRKLSLGEMQHNQMVDNVRFGLGMNTESLPNEGTETTTYHVDFVNDTENEITVYGGTLDMVSGTLTVDRVMKEFDGSSDEAWTSLSTANVFRHNALDPRVSDAMRQTGTISNECYVSDYNYAHMKQNYPSISFDGSGRLFLAISEGITTTAQCKTWLAANPLQVCYRLDSPFTYQLTPHEIKTLIGENRYSANCGSVEAVYNTEDILSEWDHSNVIVKDGGWAAGPTDTGAFTYSSTQLDAHRTTPLVATGLTNGTTYYVTVFPVSTDGAVNTDSVNRQTGIPGLIPITTVPTQSGTLTYNGANQLPEWSNYDETQMTISCTAQTNAGTYEASVTPNADYCWSDGTTSARTIQWTIGKASPEKPTLWDGSDQALGVILSPSHPTQAITVVRSGDGNITALSNNANVATVSVSDTTMTVSSVNNTSGTATITVHVAEGTNYLAYTADDVTFNVSVQFIPAVLNDATWAQISEASLAGTASSYWEVGDTKAITLSGSINTLNITGRLYVFILGFDHNAMLESSGQPSIHFGTFSSSSTNTKSLCLVDSQYMDSDAQSVTTFDQGSAKFSMNHFGGSNPNLGGWKACDMRYDILGSTNKVPYNYPNKKDESAGGYDPENYDLANSPVSSTFMSVLPRDLRLVMRPITKYTDNTGTGTGSSVVVTATIDYLPLLSEYEVTGSASNSNSSEASKQQRYQYYTSGNSAVKYSHSSSNSTALWWLRSPAEGDSSSFCAIQANGTAIGVSATLSSGIAPIFMV